MYFELTEDNACDHGIREPADLPFELDFISGTVIAPEITMPLVFTTGAPHRHDVPDFWNTAMPVMSKRFVDLLERAGVDNLQKFPARLKSTRQAISWAGYYAVNIIGKIPCADLQRSQYTEIFPGNYAFKKLVIDGRIAKGALLFRLQESPSTIIIHRRVGAFILENDLDATLKGWDVRDIE